MSDGPRVRILLPRSLRSYWPSDDAVTCSATTLADALHGLSDASAGLAARILDEQGNLRPHVLVFVNDRLVQHADTLDVKLTEGDTIRVLPAVSGG